MKTPTKKTGARGGLRAGAGRKAKPSETKFIHTSITLEPSVHALACTLSEAGRFPTLSAYFSELVKEDRAIGAKIDALANPDSAMTVLIDRLAPALRRQLDETLASRQVDQAAFVTALLTAGLRHLKSGADPDEPFAVTPLVTRLK